VNFWWRAEPPAWSAPLQALVPLWAAGTAVHRAVSRPLKVRVPVISIGNLTVGGAGKTPVTLHLAQRLAARGRRPAVLSRGYGRRSREPLEVTPEAIVDAAGDEPLWLARQGCTVLVGPRRAALAQLAVQRGADVLLLDDGLQHHALARDLDVIVADASNPFGNGRLLPAGPLREPVSALRRVALGLVWLTRCDRPRDPRTSELSAFPAVESVYEPGAAHLRGKRVFLFAGIARPGTFADTVRGLGAEIAGTQWFRDHHLFTAADLAALRQRAAGALLVTTEKDLVRIADPGEIIAVPLRMRIVRGEDALDRALEEIL
jgi:tetraacyldisaccharide 4'-kinase